MNRKLQPHPQFQSVTIIPNKACSTGHQKETMPPWWHSHSTSGSWQKLVGRIFS